MTRTANEHSIILRWDPVPGAVEYQIEYPIQNYYGDDFTWYSLRTTTETSAEAPLPPLRIIAMGEGGASEPRVITSRRRGVGRR